MSLVCIYRGAGPTDAYLLRHFLEGNEIRALVRGDLVSLRGEIPIGEAWPSLWVPEADRERAEALVRRYHGPQLVHPRWSCPGCREVNEATFEWCWNCETPAPQGSDAGDR